MGYRARMERQCGFSSFIGFQLENSIMTRAKKPFWLGPVTTISPRTIKMHQYIRIQDKKITVLQEKPDPDEPVQEADLRDYYCYPAMINPHDHLQGTYFPRVGTNRPYMSFYPWILDLMDSDTVSERKKIDNLDLYLLGSYKNIAAGVVTVQDHYPHEALPKWPQGGNNEFINHIPVRVSPEYTLAHEVHEKENQWGMGAEQEHQWAIERDWPFITHLEEGFTDECMKGIDYLKEMKALSDHTVLIHCIGLSNQDIQDIAKAGTHIVTCPFSNFYMFQVTARLREIFDAGINVSLGTDSPMSGSLYILEEMKFLKNIYYDMYHEPLEDHVIVDMVTINPAKALRIENHLGQLAPDFIADLLFVQKNDDNPYTNLVQATHRDIGLLLKEGQPIYGDTRFIQWFEDSGVSYDEIQIDKQKRLLLGEPLELIRRIRKNIGFNKPFPFLPIS